MTSIDRVKSLLNIIGHCTAYIALRHKGLMCLVIAQIQWTGYQCAENFIKVKEDRKCVFPTEGQANLEYVWVTSETGVRWWRR